MKLILYQQIIQTICQTYAKPNQTNVNTLKEH